MNCWTWCFLFSMILCIPSVMCPSKSQTMYFNHPKTLKPFTIFSLAFCFLKCPCWYLLGIMVNLKFWIKVINFNAGHYQNNKPLASSLGGPLLCWECPCGRALPYSLTPRYVKCGPNSSPRLFTYLGSLSVLCFEVDLCHSK